MEKKTILYVEDEPVVLEIGKFALEYFGYDIKSASNLKDAYDLIDKEKVDLCISDGQYPLEEGLEVNLEAWEKMYDKCKEKDVHFILNSGSLKVNEKAKLMGVETIPKPWNLDDLKKSLEEKLLEEKEK